MQSKYKTVVVAVTRRRSLSATMDILEWLKDNGPRDYPELKHLRHALYRRTTQLGYSVRYDIESTDEYPRFVITGRTGSLLIVSDKARHFLLRTLCRMLRH